MSTIVKTAGDSPAGPFTREKVVVGRQAHNAYYIQDQCGEPPARYQNGCTNGTTPAKSQLSREDKQENVVVENPFPFIFESAS